MRRYWYYTYATECSTGFGVCYTENGNFPLNHSLEFQEERLKRKVVITFWKEISSQEFYGLVNNHTK